MSGCSPRSFGTERCSLDVIGCSIGMFVHHRFMLWCSEATPDEQWKETKDPRTKTQTNAKEEDQKLFLNREFLKSLSFYKCRSTSFYREMNELFTYRDCPRVKRIDTKCARLILEGLQLGLHVIDALWCHAVIHDAFPGVNTCACWVKTLNFLEMPPSPSPSLHLKHILELESECIKS
jgi:hypothetical protein